jgi:hypothetical protein
MGGVRKDYCSERLHAESARPSVKDSKIKLWEIKTVKATGSGMSAVESRGNMLSISAEFCVWSAAL